MPQRLARLGPIPPRLQLSNHPPPSCTKRHPRLTRLRIRDQPPVPKGLRRTPRRTVKHAVDVRCPVSTGPVYFQGVSVVEVAGDRAADGSDTDECAISVHAETEFHAARRLVMAMMNRDECTCLPERHRHNHQGRRHSNHPPTRTPRQPDRRPHTPDQVSSPPQADPAPAEQPPLTIPTVKTVMTPLTHRPQIPIQLPTRTSPRIIQMVQHKHPRPHTPTTPARRITTMLT